MLRTNDKNLMLVADDDADKVGFPLHALDFPSEALETVMGHSFMDG